MLSLIAAASPVPTGLQLRLVSETASTFTLGWDPVPADGFRFTSPSGRRSHTWDGSRTSVRFSKAAGTVHVEPFRVTGDATFDWPVV